MAADVNRAALHAGTIRQAAHGVGVVSHTGCRWKFGHGRKAHGNAHVPVSPQIYQKKQSQCETPQGKPNEMSQRRSHTSRYRLIPKCAIFLRVTPALNFSAYHCVTCQRFGDAIYPARPVVGKFAERRVLLAVLSAPFRWLNARVRRLCRNELAQRPIHPPSTVRMVLCT